MCSCRRRLLFLGQIHGSLVMWFLVWLNFTTTGEINYYQISTHGSEEVCLLEKEKAKVIVTKSNETIACLWAEK